MLNTESISNAVILLFSILLLAWIIPENTPPYQGYGVSPALIPNVTAGIMLFLSFFGLVRSARAARAGKPVGRKADAGAFFEKLRHVAKFLIPCFLLFPAMELCGEIPGLEQRGFFPAGILFMIWIQFICGQKNWLQNVLISVLLVAGLYAAMRYGFSISMP